MTEWMRQVHQKSHHKEYIEEEHQGDHQHVSLSSLPAMRIQHVGNWGEQLHTCWPSKSWYYKIVTTIHSPLGNFIHPSEAFIHLQKILSHSRKFLFTPRKFFIHPWATSFTPRMFLFTPGQDLVINLSVGVFIASSWAFTPAVFFSSSQRIRNLFNLLFDIIHILNLLIEYWIHTALMFLILSNSAFLILTYFKTSQPGFACPSWPLSALPRSSAPGSFPRSTSSEQQRLE